MELLPIHIIRLVKAIICTAVHLLKQLHPGSWYKFKYANRHIPPRSRRVVYDVEMRKFDERIRNPKTFENLNDGIDGIIYINKNRDNK